MLEGEIEVRDARVADRVDQLVIEIGWVEVEKPNPIDPLCDRLDELDNLPLTYPLIPTVCREILTRPTRSPWLVSAPPRSRSNRWFVTAAFL